MIQCARTKRPKDSEDDSNEAETDSPEVDWYQLQVNTLRRYKRHYKVPTRPGLNKAQLADVCIYFFIFYVTSMEEQRERTFAQQWVTMGKLCNKLWC